MIKMEKITAFMILLVAPALVMCQRPSFAGSKPIGYPDLPNRTTTEGLGDRFGEGDTTTQRLPIEANGDRDLVDRLSKLPIDQQPFWLINWQALEAHRNKPQTFGQRPNGFLDAIPNQQANTGLSTNSGSANVNLGSNNVNSVPTSVNSGSSNVNSGSSNSNSAASNTGNRFESDNSPVKNTVSGTSETTTEKFSINWFISQLSTTEKARP